MTSSHQQMPADTRLSTSTLLTPDGPPGTSSRYAGFASDGESAWDSLRGMPESEQTHSDDDRHWPVDCPLCGATLASAVIDLDTTNENRAEFQAGEMIAVDYCPNPACPSKNAPQSAPQDPGS